MDHLNIEVFDAAVLEHHGVEGQRWGHKNGPPYPLDSVISTGKALREKYRAKKAESEERKRVRKEESLEKKRIRAERAKRKIINSGDEEAVRKIQSKLTYEEFEEAVKRCELNKRAVQSSIKPKTDWDKRMDELRRYTGNAKAGIEAWNTMAAIYNSVGDGNDRLKRIG